MPIRVQQGTMMTSEKEKYQRWKEHFEGILNPPDSNNRSDVLST